MLLKDLIYLFYPKYCAACDVSLRKNERLLCTLCRHQLPRYNFHDINVKKIEKVFYGRVKIENATALLVYEKEGLVQQLLHNLKYRGQQEIGKELGAWLGVELAQSVHYQNIDFVIPVPLHPKRLRERGYNQVAQFGKELAHCLDADYVDTVLKKNAYHSKQSKQRRLTRWNNIAETFSLAQPSILKGKHIVLVDDIITTGATIESCVTVLQEIPDLKISVATMAITV